jgi:hypothetical protein
MNKLYSYFHIQFLNKPRVMWLGRDLRVQSNRERESENDGYPHGHIPASITDVFTLPQVE